MFTSFSTALSALDAMSTAIDVVGNNLANLNTPGFKDSTTYFRDLVTESLGAGLGETQVGFGTGTPMTIRHFTQGAIQSSTGVLDAAIGEQQLGAGYADIGAGRPAHQRFEPPAIAHRDVVIEEDEHRSQAGVRRFIA